MICLLPSPAFLETAAAGEPVLADVCFGRSHKCLCFTWWSALVCKPLRVSEPHHFMSSGASQLLMALFEEKKEKQNFIILCHPSLVKNHV